MNFAPITNPIVAKQEALTARGAANEAQAEIYVLKQNVERLLLITEALWTFIKENHPYEDEELFKEMINIDMKDGKLDGKVSPEGPKKCPHCDHILLRRKPFCVYCGKTVIRDAFER